MLRQLRINPAVSAYEYINGKFDYNRMPLAPMGCAVQVHASPNRRLTWAEHSLDGWYLKTSEEHYRCHVIFIKKTHSKRISDTVIFQHRYITNPIITPEDKVVKALGDVKQALMKKENLRGQEQMDALQCNDAILKPSSQKRVTFQDDVDAQPRVAVTEQQHHGDVSPPIPTWAPRVATALVDKPLNTGPATNTQAQRKARIRQTLLSMFNKRANREALTDEIVEFANHAILDENGKAITYRHLMKDPELRKIWSPSSANKFGRLAQGIGRRIKGTDTIRFIHKQQILADCWKDVTYVKFVCEEKPNKEEKYRTRMAIGGNKVNYPEDVGTPTADLLLVKTHLNSVISTPKAKYLSLDISNFYLNNPMVRSEYARIHIDDIPDEVIEEYNLRDKVVDGYVYIEIVKGMYGLPQAGILAQELLEKRLAEYGYTQSKIIHGLWKHSSRPTAFTLVVNDFGVQYISMEDANHLIDVLQKYNQITIDWTGSKYIGLTLDWDYHQRRMHLSMPGYIQKALERLHPHAVTIYGAKAQYVEKMDDSPPLDKAGQKFIQAVTGTLLNYARAVDPTILVVECYSITASQTYANNYGTSEAVVRLLCKSRRGSANLQCKQYDIGRSQRRRIFE